MSRRPKRIDNCLECKCCTGVKEGTFSFVYSEVEQRTCMRAHVTCEHIEVDFPRIEWACKKFDKRDVALVVDELA
jgi:hypothetical protein